MAAKLEIMNAALARVGANLIQSLDEPTVEQRMMTTMWDISRRVVLRDHPWNFAITDIQLATPVQIAQADVARVVRQSNYAPAEYRYSFAIPTNCIRVLKVYNAGDYVIQGARIYSNQPQCRLRYVQDITDPTLFSSSFDDLLAQRLAHDIAYGLTKAQTTADSMFAIYKDKLKTARFIDSTEDYLEPLGGSGSQFINARW